MGIPEQKGEARGRLGVMAVEEVQASREHGRAVVHMSVVVPGLAEWQWWWEWGMRKQEEEKVAPHRSCVPAGRQASGIS